jgi:hypothetical protein
MSSINKEETMKKVKLTSLFFTKPLRLVSAQPTLYDNSLVSSNNAQVQDKSSDLKLKINASVFVPKE